MIGLTLAGMDRAPWAKVAEMALPAFLLLWLLRPRRASKQPLPPSVPGHWLFGHALMLPDLSDPHAPHLDLTLMDWAKKYGWTIFSFWVPVVGRFIVAADPALVKHVLVTENYPKSPTYEAMLPVLGERSMIIAEGAAWTAKRRLFKAGFKPEFLRGCVATVAEKAITLCDRCDAAALASEELSMHASAVDFTADVIAQVAFGEDWGRRGGRADAPSASHGSTRQLMFDLQWECTQNNNTPWRKFTNPMAQMRIRQLQRLLDADMEAVVQRRISIIREELASSSSSQTMSRQDILSLALTQVLKQSADSLGEAVAANLKASDILDVVSQMKTFFFAGHDTTSTLISWAIWLLSRHPEALSRVRTEVADELGPWGRGERAAVPPTYDALQCCVYLEAVLQETLRLYPPAGSCRFVADPTATFGGYCIGNAIIYVSHYVLHRHPALWDEPDAFKPERFLKSEAGVEQKLKSSATDPYAFGPFSRGPKDCIGKYFAMIEGKVAVAALVAAFDFEAVNPDETISFAVTQCPSHGARMCVRHRQ